MLHARSQRPPTLNSSARRLHAAWQAAQLSLLLQLLV